MQRVHTFEYKKVIKEELSDSKKKKATKQMRIFIALTGTYLLYFTSIIIIITIFHSFVVRNIINKLKKSFTLMSMKERHFPNVKRCFSFSFINTFILI